VKVLRLDKPLMYQLHSDRILSQAGPLLTVFFSDLERGSWSLSEALDDPFEVRVLLILPVLLSLVYAVWGEDELAQ
jgi:hypothetical protein